MSSKEFHENVHSLRSIAIWSIVAGHVIDVTPWPTGSPWPRLLYSIFENGSLLFVFVAGYLFQHLHQRYRYLPYLKRKIARVIVPYLIVSIPSIILALWFGNVPAHYPQLAGHSRAYQIGWMYLTGGSHVNFALWFIPMIALFYLAAPLFSAIIRHPVLYWILPPLAVLSVLIHRVPNPSLGIIHMALYLLPAYVAGMWCSQFGAALRLQHALGAVGLWIALVGCLTLPAMVLSHVGNYEEPGYFTFVAGIIDWLFVARMGTAFLALALLLQAPRWLNRRLAPFAATSFGIFFTHCYWLQLFINLQARISTPGSILAWVLTTIAIFAASHWSLVLIDRLFPRAGGYFVGNFGDQRGRLPTARTIPAAR